MSFNDPSYRNLPEEKRIYYLFMEQLSKECSDSAVVKNGSVAKSTLAPECFAQDEAAEA